MTLSTRRPARALVAVAAVAASTLVITSAGSAFAADPPSVTVPRHTTDGSTVDLLSVSGNAILARQGQDRLLRSAPTGGAMTLDATRIGPGFTAVDQHLFRWTERNDPQTDKPVYFTTDYTIGGPVLSGLGQSQEPVVVTANGSIQLDGSTLKYGAATLATGVDRVTAAASDPTGSIVAYQTTGTTPEQRLLLVTFDGGTPKTADVPNAEGALVSTVGISDTTVAWVTTAGSTTSLHRRARAGGAVTTRTVPADADIREPLAVAGDRVAWKAGPRSLSVATADGIVFNSGISGTAVDGVRGYAGSIYVGEDGPNTVAGVYSDNGGGALKRIATVSNQPATVSSFSLSSGYLHYADDTFAATPGDEVWGRSVAGTDAPKLSVPGQFDTQVLPVPDRPISFSAGRGVVVTPANRIQLVDQGAATATLAISGDHAFEASGPYGRVDGRIYTTTGRLLVNLPATNKVSGIDQYGAYVVYSTADGTIWWRDLRKAASSTNPARIAKSATEAPDVAVWGNIVAYQSGSEVVLRNQTTGATGSVPLAPLGAAGTWQLRSLQLSEGTLHVASQDAHEVDSDWVAPVEARTGIALTQITGLSRVTTDGHWVSGLTGAGDIRIQRLPFGAAQPTRLIGTLAATTFSPNGDGTGDTWAPEFDVSKAVKNVVLTIRSGSTVVRTLTAPQANDGSIRHLSWNGRNNAGDRAPNGTYTYALTANSVDGEGTLRNTDNRGGVTGTVSLKR